MTISTFARRAGSTSATSRCRSARRLRLSRPVVKVAVLVLDHDRAVVRPHACFGKRQGSRAKRAFGRDASDEPMGAAAAGAMVDFVLAVDGVIAPLVRLPGVAGNRHDKPSFRRRQRANGPAVASGRKASQRRVAAKATSGGEPPTSAVELGL